MTRPTPIGSLALVITAGIVLIAAGGQTAASATRPALVRVDGLGYVPGESKVAYLLARHAADRTPFSVTDAAGRTVWRGRAGRNRGPWNASYRTVLPLDVTRLRTPGSYRIRVDALGVVSPPFRIASPAALFRPRVADTVVFFQAQRDGAA